MLADPDLVIGLATQLKAERQRVETLTQDVAMLGAKTLDQEKELEAAAPKVLFADSVSASESSILIGELAKILKQNGIEIGQNRLFEWMRNNDYLCSRGESYNLPTQRAMELKLFEIKKTSITQPDGTVFVTSTTKVTPKGQMYFVNSFLYGRA
jgi:anti-repressor protein